MPTATKKRSDQKRSLGDLKRQVSKLTVRVEELEDLRDLNSAVSRNSGKRGVAWSKAKASLGLA